MSVSLFDMTKLVRLLLLVQLVGLSIQIQQTLVPMERIEFSKLDEIVSQLEVLSDYRGERGG